MRKLIAGLIAGFVLGTAATATAAVGMTPERAATRIEFNVRVVSSDLIAWATDELRTAKQIGGPVGIATAQRDLRTAKAGMEVDHAACLGVRRASGGYTSFRCKLKLSAHFAEGWERGTARGTYTLVNGSWRWRTASLTHWSVWS
jgi:hypothetical protein